VSRKSWVSGDASGAGGAYARPQAWAFAGRGAIEFVDYLTEALDKTSDGSPGIVVLEARPSRRNERPN
jgi:hypothetical protein